MRSGVAFLFLCVIASAAESAKPNIVVILADDLGFADVGFHGCRDIPTPHIDSLAQNGIRFTNGYVSGPYCSPTRAGFLTGRYQNRYGHEFNPGKLTADGKPAGLPLSETTIAQRLKAAGYTTGIVGKWHLGEAEGMHPLDRGFDQFFGFLEGAHVYFPGEKTRIRRNRENVVEPDYLTDAFGREAVQFLDRHQKQPFFLYLAFNAVHTPMHATDARLKQFAAIEDEQRRTYAAMHVAMDEAIGQVLAKLRSAGVEDNTLIFFFSDNGGPTMKGTTINASRNTPLRGSKRTTAEGGIHVPFVVQWKGKLKAQTEYTHPVIQLDILPTALAAAGVEARPDWKLDGVNLLPYLTGQNTDKPHETLYWRFGTQMAIRHGDWKLVKYDVGVDGGESPFPGDSATVTNPRLYNLAADISESHDLAQANPAKLKELSDIWQKWNAELPRPLWGAGSKH